MPKRISLPSMLPPEEASLAAVSAPARASAGLPACSAATVTAEQGHEDDRHGREQRPALSRGRRPCAPKVKHSAAGMSRIASISRKLESGVGFSNGCAEFTLKKPPPLVPSCLMATCEAAGPDGDASARASTASPSPACRRRRGRACRPRRPSASRSRRLHRLRLGVRGERLHHALGDERQGEHERQRQQDVERRARRDRPRNCRSWPRSCARSRGSARRARRCRWRPRRSSARSAPSICVR